MTGRWAPRRHAGPGPAREGALHAFVGPLRPCASAVVEDSGRQNPSVNGGHNVDPTCVFVAHDRKSINIEMAPYTPFRMPPRVTQPVSE
jgi:hypothetical protein